MKSSNHKFSWRKVPNPFLAFSLLACASFICAVACQAAGGGKNNIFAGQEPGSQPGFKKAPDNPAALQDRAIPDIRLIIALPSLEAAQRKQIQNLYKESQVRLAGLRTEINTTRSRLQKLAQKGGQNGNAESSEPATEPAAERGNSQNPPDQFPMVVGEQMEQSPQDLSAHAKELQTQIRNERQNLWDQVRPLLTDQQLEDLAKMRRGEFMPQTTEAAK
jgi:hypothetical protein